MPKAPIQLVYQDHTALVTIAREGARNALDDHTIQAFVGCFMGLRGRPGLRAVVLTGAGEHSFCAGYDIACIDPDQPLEDPLPDDRFATATQAVLDSPVPVVAALRGGAWGGGLDLALACDLRVAHPGVRLAMTPCKLGLVYRHQGLQRFAARIGLQATRRLFLTATTIGADEALRLGIVDAVDPDPLALAQAWAGTIASNAPLAVAGVRAALAALERDPALGDPTTAAALHAQRLRAFASTDLRRGLEAAEQRRSPAFEGD
jgi:enoyl-CoA hydratase/carnithine racemase